MRLSKKTMLYFFQLESIQCNDSGHMQMRSDCFYHNIFKLHFVSNCSGISIVFFFDLRYQCLFISWL